MFVCVCVCSGNTGHNKRFTLPTADPDDKINKDESDQVTANKSNGRSKLSSFRFLERCSENLSKMEEKGTSSDSSVDRKKSGRHQSGNQKPIFSIVQDAADVADDDRDDFQAECTPVRFSGTEFLTSNRRSILHPVCEDQCHSPASVTDGMDVSVDRCSAISDSQMEVETRTKTKQIVDEEGELRLSQLLPLPSVPRRKGDESPGSKLEHIRTPPSIEEIRLTFEQFDKQGHISPVNVFDLVEKWERSRSAAGDLQGSALDSSRMQCESEQNSCKMRTSLLCTEFEDASKTEDRNVMDVQESILGMYDKNNSVGTELASKQTKKLKTDNKMSVGNPMECNNSLANFDEICKQLLTDVFPSERTQLSGRKSVGPDVESASSRTDSDHTVGTKQMPDEVTHVDGVKKDFTVQQFTDISIDVDDFCEPFTIEALSGKHADVVHSDGNDPFEEEEDDCIFVDVSYNVPKQESAMVNAADKSQLTFTQALNSLDTTVDISHDMDMATEGEKHVETKRTGSSLLSRASVNRSVDDGYGKKSHNNEGKSDEIHTKEISEIDDTTQIKQPQFDLGFDLDFDLEDFEDEIVPPSPEHVTHPPSLRHLDRSGFKTVNQTIIGTSIRFPKSATPDTAPRERGDGKCSPVPRVVTPSFKLPFRPVAVIAPSGGATVTPSKSKSAETGSGGGRQLNVFSSTAPKHSMDRHAETRDQVTAASVCKDDMSGNIIGRQLYAG